jgi:hypothetical protein
MPSTAVQNPGEEPVSLGLACAPLGFRVRDATGRRVSPPSGCEDSFACTEGIENLVLAGGSKNYVFL